MNYNQLLSVISDTHSILQTDAFRSVNINLSLRNWLFGMYIVEFEQSGEDRAAYGETLIRNIADNYTNRQISGLSFRNLQLFEQFYLMYPQIVQTASAQLDFFSVNQLYPNQLQSINLIK